MNRIISVLTLLVITTTFSNTSAQSSSGNPIKIILDTDMGSDCDDVGAMALLHRYADEGKLEILGVIYSSETIPFGVGVIDAINVYYNRPDLPIGASYGTEVGDPKDKMSAEKLARDTAAFGNRIIQSKDVKEQTKLNRELLVNQPDESVTYVTIGHTKGLYQLLVSKPDDISPLSGMELVEKKVKRWVALGALGANNADGHYRQDWNFFRNKTSPYTEYVVNNFPNEVYFINAGSKVMTGASLKQSPAGNIVRTAYRDWLWNTQKKTLDDQRPSWDLAAVYFAVLGLGEFLQYEKSGWVDFQKEKGSLWITDGKRRFDNHFYINQKDDVDLKFADYLNKMILKE